MKKTQTINIPEPRTKPLSLDTFLDGSFLATTGSFEAPEADKVYSCKSGFNIYLSRQANNIHKLENDDFFLLLEGTFYLSKAQSVDPNENLMLFLHDLTKSSLKEVSLKIAGGLFNLMIVDKQLQQVSVVNDRLALLPLFWQYKDDTVSITNNQLNLQVKSKPSRSALIEFLKYGYLPVSPSLLEGVQRLGVEMTLEFSLVSQKINTHRQSRIPKYPKHVKTNDKKHFIQQWHHAFKTYFGRVKGQTMLGLSGGYDSRLLAAYTAKLKPTLLNFGQEDSTETVIASQVAAHLKLDLEKDHFPQDALVRHASRLRTDFRNPTSLENVHVLHLGAKISAQSPDYYLDGFLGGAIMSDAYFAKRPSSFKGIYDYIIGSNKFDTPRQSHEDYVNTLYYQDKQGLADETLSGLMTKADSRTLKSRFSKLVSEWSHDSSYHADVIERLSLLSRGRNLIANGPVSLSTHMKTLIPFLDYNIQDLSINTPKSMRFAHSLYNSFWHRFFPGLAKIRKAGTFGRAVDMGISYRLKAILFALYKRYWFPIIQKVSRSKNFQEEEYFSTDWYLANRENARLIKSVMKTPVLGIPTDIYKEIKQGYENQTIHKSLLLRYVTLALLLKGNS